VCYLRSVSPEQFDLDHSVEVLAMVIVGGLGSVLGSFFGAALVLFAPIVFNNLIGYGADRLGLSLNADLRAHLPLMLYGALIIIFLVIEPLGLAKIYDNIRNYFLVWPFRTARR
jgi:branched-chain amino acid transport system permease protein